MTLVGLNINDNTMRSILKFLILLFILSVATVSFVGIILILFDVVISNDEGRDSFLLKLYKEI